MKQGALVRRQQLRDRGNGSRLREGRKPGEPNLETRVQARAPFRVPLKESYLGLGFKV